MPIDLVGIMGRAGSGKDTIADLMVHEFEFTKVSMALPLKEGLAKMLGVPLELMDNREQRELPYKNYNVSIRQMLQTLGTDWGREMVSPDIWVDGLIEKVKSINAPVVVPDVRFSNEARAIREYGGVLIEVSRPDNPEVVPAHASENVPLRFADYRFVNDKSIKDLEASVTRLLLALLRD
jgi:hypothetical protein